MATAVSVALDAETRERTRRLADARGREPHYFMREAISQYLDREQARESFKQETLSSWAEFQKEAQSREEEQRFQDEVKSVVRQLNASRAAMEIAASLGGAPPSMAERPR